VRSVFGEIGPEQGPKYLAVIGDLEVQELMDDDLSPKGGGGREQIDVKRDSSRRGAASPFSFHAAKMELVNFDANSPGPSVHFGLENVPADNLA
jgi:hypothetical protein